MNLEEIRLDIIRPSLHIVDLYTPESENKLVETYTDNIMRDGFGPWRCSLKSYSSVKKILNSKVNEKLSDRILAACYFTIYPPIEAMAVNIRLACLIQRMLI